MAVRVYDEVGNAIDTYEDADMVFEVDDHDRLIVQRVVNPGDYEMIAVYRFSAWASAVFAKSFED